MDAGAIHELAGTASPQLSLTLSFLVKLLDEAVDLTAWCDSREIRIPWTKKKCYVHRLKRRNEVHAKSQISAAIALYRAEHTPSQGYSRMHWIGTGDSAQSRKGQAECHTILAEYAYRSEDH